jgi:hypothetical protein
MRDEDCISAEDIKHGERIQRRTEKLLQKHTLRLMWLKAEIETEKTSTRKAFEKIASGCKHIWVECLHSTWRIKMCKWCGSSSSREANPNTLECHQQDVHDVIATAGEHRIAQKF